MGAGLRLETTSPLAPMLTDALAAATGAGGLAPHTALGVSHVLGRLVAVVADEGAAAEPMRQAVQVARRTQILRQIELGFTNPLLDPARVARAAGISVRSLHLALEPTGRSFSEHLTERGQLAGNLDVPVVHTVELLDWAYGGPVPPGLEPLVRFVSNVPEPKRRTEDFIHA